MIPTTKLALYQWLLLGNQLSDLVPRWKFWYQLDSKLIPLACEITKMLLLQSLLRFRLVGRKTFFWKIVFLHFQFYIVWLAKECKTIFPWSKITLLMMENHFPFKMKRKLFSLSLTTSLLSLSYFFHFIIFLTWNQTTEN